MDRLYVIVRADLPTGLQLAQACHAVIAFTEAHAARPENLVVLHAAGEQQLAELGAALAERGLQTAAFHEPDLGGALTAIAAHGALARKALQRCALAFSAAA